MSLFSLPPGYFKNQPDEALLEMLDDDNPEVRRGAEFELNVRTAPEQLKSDDVLTMSQDDYLASRFAAVRKLYQ